MVKNVQFIVIRGSWQLGSDSVICDLL